MAKVTRRKSFKKNLVRKLHIKFNKDERKEYLLGFHKRKVERRKKAQEQIKQKEKAERKKIKEEYKAMMQRMIDEAGGTREADDNTSYDFEEAHQRNEADAGLKKVVHQIGGSTVEISNLDLCSADIFLGNNKGSVSRGGSTSHTIDFLNTEHSSEKEKYQNHEDITNAAKRLVARSITKTTAKVLKGRKKLQKRKWLKSKQDVLVTKL